MTCNARDLDRLVDGIESPLMTEWYDGPLAGTVLVHGVTRSWEICDGEACLHFIVTGDDGTLLGWFA